MINYGGMIDADKIISATYKTILRKQCKLY